MKTIFAAIAIAFAVPAAAQTAPAQGHDQHQQHGQHGQHGSGHGDHKKGEMPCDMSKEECRKACAEMHGKDKGKGGDHAGHHAPKS